VKRAPKIIALAIAAVVVLVLAATAFMATYDWNRVKPWLSQKVGDATGRPFEIKGDLWLTWHRQESQADGWRSIIPWPHFRAEQVVMGNPAWAKAAVMMAKIERIEFSINPFLLPRHEIVIPTLVLKQPDFMLERIADGRNNWTFKSPEDPGSWKLALGRVELNDGQVRLVDAVRKADITALLQSLPQTDPAGYKMRWSLKGKLEGEDVTGSGKSGPLLALREQSKPYPLDARIQVGNSKLAATGTVTLQRSLAAMNVNLELSGPSMANLYPITTLLLPETAAYSTRGHLRGKFNEDGGHWVYENFTGKVGASDVSGTLNYQGGKPRPKLHGTIVSEILRLQDLGALIGTSAGLRNRPEESSRKSRSPKSRDQVLPTKVFRSYRWNSLDADVKFTGNQIVRSVGLPIENLETRLLLADGVLHLNPLNFGVAGGLIRADTRLDGRGSQIKAQMKVNARKLQLKRMFPAAESMRASVGVLNGDAKLTGTGDSIAALLGSSSGEITLLVDRGSISKLLLETAGLNVGSMIVTRIFGDEQIDINCMISDFTVEKGLMKTRAFVIDTEDAIVTMDGSINLATEKLDLVVNPQSRELRLLTLRSPLYITGSFRKPSIEVDKGVLAAKAGGAIVLGLLAPMATALLPLVNTGEEQESGCQSLLNQANKAPARQPAGRSANSRRTR
jgi:uncharacterized protein involved in outer membrane biogenesis